MRIAVLSDIHGNFQALTSILDDIKKQNVDQIIINGDLIGLGPNSKECLDLVMNKKIDLILGNHEQYFLDNYTGIETTPLGEKKQREWINNSLGIVHKNFLKGCPYELEYDMDGYRTYITHYAVKNGKFEKRNKENQTDVIVKLFPKRDLVVFGHNHIGGVIKTSDTTFINLKSSGCTKSNETFYTLITLKQSGFLIEEKKITYNREMFESVHYQTDYPNKEVTGPLFFNTVK